ncbi:MAG: glycosyltransferase [Candidatus Thiodiazotropha sp.]
MELPLVSLILPVYNGEEFLAPCLESIVKQTYKNIEVIIINDGSTDNTHKIIEEYKPKIENLIYINRGNKGLIASLNEGVNSSSGEYIARMDADDICSLNRIEVQVNCLINNSDVTACGCSVIKINKSTEQIGSMKMPLKYRQILVRAMFRSPIIHPTVMMRAKNISQYLPDLYSIKFLHAEDYELWARLLGDGHKVVNIKSKLLYYRIHEKSITISNSFDMKSKSHDVRSKYLLKILGKIPTSALRSISCLSTRAYMEVGDDGCNKSFFNYLYNVGILISGIVLKKLGFLIYITYLKEYVKFMSAYYKHKLHW